MTNTITKPIDIKALRGIAEVLEAAITAKPPHVFIITDEHGKREEIQNRERLLEHYLEYAIESIYEWTDSNISSKAYIDFIQEFDKKMIEIKNYTE